jgi:hypothetical protein
MLPVPAFLPLETLPSWPAVPDPTVVQILIPTLFIPLAITAVIALLVLGPGWRRPSE